MTKFTLTHVLVFASLTAWVTAFVPSTTTGTRLLNTKTTVLFQAAPGSFSAAADDETNKVDPLNKKKRPETRLESSTDSYQETTSSDVDATTTDPVQLSQLTENFSSLMQNIIQDPSNPANNANVAKDEPAQPQDLATLMGKSSFSQDDMRLLRAMLEDLIKEKPSKFTTDDYWKDVRKPVDEATTINPEVFRSPEFFELEKDMLLAATWQCVGSTDQVREAGSVLATQVAGRPVIITRSHNKEDGGLRAFYNTCRHRGARLVSEEESGTCKKSLRCPYHNWGYSLDGKLMGTPNWNANEDGKKGSKPGSMMANSNAVRDFDKAENGLIPVRVAEWGPFLYVNLNGEAPPLEEYLGRVVTDLEAFPFDQLVTVKADTFPVKANWKLLAENYIDFYHLSTVHPDYAQVSVPEDHIRAQGDGMYAGYVTYPLSNAGTPLDLDRFPVMKGLEGTKHEVTGWYQIHFPNMFFFLLPHSLFMVHLEATSIGTTVEHCRLLVHKDGLEQMGEEASKKAIEDMWAYYFNVNTEDFQVCEKTQVGIAAEAFKGGRMTYGYEESLNRYHNMIANCLTGKAHIVPKGDAEPSYFDKIPVYGYKEYMANLAKEEAEQAAKNDSA